MKNKKVLIIVTFAILSIILLLVLFIPVLNIKGKIPSVHNDKWESLENGDTVSDYRNGYNFESYNKETYTKYEILIKNFNPSNPELIFVGDTEHLGVRIIQYKFSRKSLSEFDLQSFRIIRVNNTTFQEAIEIAKTYDLSKENPDPENIIVYEPPTKEQIEVSKKEKEIKENPEYLQKIKDCEDKYFTKENMEPEKVVECVEGVDREFGVEIY